MQIAGDTSDNGDGSDRMGDDHASTSGTDPRSNSTGSDSSNDTVSGDEAHGTVIASRRTLERKDERLPSQPPRPRPPRAWHRGQTGWRHPGSR